MSDKALEDLGNRKNQSVEQIANILQKNMDELLLDNVRIPGYLKGPEDRFQPKQSEKVSHKGKGH